MGQLSLDGVDLVVGDRIAVMGQTDPTQNGIYEVLNSGSSSEFGILIRSDDFQSQQQMKPGLYLPISAGTINAGEMLVLVEPAPMQVGLSPITFEKVSAAMGGGTAASKDATDNTQPDVASVKGAFVVNDIIIAADVLGTIKDSGTSPSDATKPKVSSVDGAATIGHLAVFSDIAGTITDGGPVPTGSGTVGAGTIHQVAAYPGAGTTVNGVNILQDAAGNSSMDWMTRQLYNSANQSILNWNTQLLTYVGGITSLDWQNAILHDNAGANSINYTMRQVYAGVGVLSLDYQNRELFYSDGTTVAYNWQLGQLFDATGALTVYANFRQLFDASGVIAAGWSARVLYGTSGALTSVNWGTRRLYNTAGTSIVADWSTQHLNDNVQVLSADWNARILYDAAAAVSLDWDNRQLVDEVGALAINYTAAFRQLNDASSNISLDWHIRRLYASDGTTVNLDWNSPAGVIVNGVQVTGTPAVGYIPTATSASTATWQAPAASGNVSAGTINEVAVYAAAGTTVSGSTVLRDASNVLSIGFMARQMFNAAGQEVMNWDLTQIFDSSGFNAGVWSNRSLYANGGVVVALDWSNAAGIGVQGLRVSEAANGKQGIATLVAGVATVSNTSITANSRIFLTAQDNNSIGALRISARTVGASFTITSSLNTDNGVVAWECFEPA